MRTLAILIWTVTLLVLAFMHTSGVVYLALFCAIITAAMWVLADDGRRVELRECHDCGRAFSREEIIARRIGFAPQDKCDACTAQIKTGK